MVCSQRGSSSSASSQQQRQKSPHSYKKHTGLLLSRNKNKPDSIKQNRYKRQLTDFLSNSKSKDLKTSMLDRSKPFRFPAYCPWLYNCFLHLVLYSQRKMETRFYIVRFQNFHLRNSSTLFCHSSNLSVKAGYDQHKIKTHCKHRKDKEPEHRSQNMFRLFQPFCSDQTFYPLHYLLHLTFQSAISTAKVLIP